jgi:predicted transposase/invertase (TIGR01784 family)
MAALDYTFKNDILFKILFVRRPDLLKRLVSVFLRLRSAESIREFEITNPEIPADVVGDKFCRLDINMKVDGKPTDLEIQVEDEKDYPERSVYYWAREYSGALKEGMGYQDLPQTIVISILGFKQFKCREYHSEFHPLEITRYTELTDKMSLHYFELPKVPEAVGTEDELGLWLTLFKAETVEELERIEKLGVPVMREAISAYRSVTATDEFKELERQRHFAKLNRITAIKRERNEGRAEGMNEGYRKAEEKWQGVVAEVVAEKDALVAKVIAEKDAQAALIAQLQAQLAEAKSKESEDEAKAFV